jgi:TolB protein
MSAMSASHRVRLLVLLAVAATAVPLLRGEAPPPKKSAETAIRNFEDALFFSTRDGSGYGQHAVDLYWAAQEHSGDNLNSDFYRKLSSLYARLDGSHLIHVGLSDAGWTVAGPNAPLILAEGQLSNVLIIVANQTSRAQTVRVKIRGENTSAPEKQLRLDALESTAFLSEIVAGTLGALHAQLGISGERETSAVLAGEIRPAVHLRVHVVDAKGDTTPARVYVRGADGMSYAAPGAFDRIMWMTGEHFFYTPGLIDMQLPAGKTRVEVWKGFDYQPGIREIDLTPKTPVISVRLKWQCNMNASGWYGGDDHIHGNYVGEQWTAPPDDLLAVRGEGLNVGNMMVANSVGDAIHDERFFEGKPNRLSRGDAILEWNQEMRSGSYGHLLLLNLKHLVEPLYTGFPGAKQWEDYPSNYSQAQQARDEGGVALYAHPALKFDEIPVGSLAGEAVADVALQSIDAMEVFCSHDEPSMELWYRFLNLGFRLGLSGGSDAFLNQRFSFLPGGERVYVYTGGGLGYASWIDGLRCGRSFATVGPLLTFEVDGNPPGAELHFASGPASVSIRAKVSSVIPISRIEIVANGRVVATASKQKPTNHLQWKGTVSLAQSSWLAARVWAPDNDRISNGPSRWSERRSASLTLGAHSSPAYVYIGHQPIFSAPDRDFCLRWLDGLADRVRKNGKFATDSHRDQVLSTFARARRVYEAMGVTTSQPHSQ